MSTPQCHEINVMTFDAECHEICFVGRKTNVMTLMSWDLENVMTFIFRGTGARNNIYIYMYLTYSMKYLCSHGRVLFCFIVTLSPVLSGFSPASIHVIECHRDLYAEHVCSCCMAFLVLNLGHYREFLRHQDSATLWLICPWSKWPPFWQTICSNAFFWMKIIEFRFKFHWNLLPGV